MSNKEVKHGIERDNSSWCLCGKYFKSAELFNAHIHQETMKQVEEIVKEMFSKDYKKLDGKYSISLILGAIKVDILNKLKELSND